MLLLEETKLREAHICMQTWVVLTTSPVFLVLEEKARWERVSLKSKRRHKGIFQPCGLVWTHIHTNRKNQNKGFLKSRKALKGVRT